MNQRTLLSLLELQLVRSFVTKCVELLGIEIEFTGKGTKEVGVEKCHGKYQLEMGSVAVEIDPNYYRPTEVDILVEIPKRHKKSLVGNPNMIWML